MKVISNQHRNVVTIPSREGEPNSTNELEEEGGLAQGSS